MKFSTRWPKQTFIEGAFVASLAILCAILTVLQFHWTGQLSQAAQERLSSTLGEQSQLLCQAFDAEVLAARNRLAPRDEEAPGRPNPQMAYVERLRRWQAEKQRPIFSRLGVAINQGSTLRFFLLDQKSAQLIPAAWPPEWNTLRRDLEQRASGTGTPVPFKDPRGLLRELAVPGGANTTESEWMIFELDLGYLQRTWMPELVRTYLNPNRQPVDALSITTDAPPQETLFSAGDADHRAPGKMVSLPLNQQTWTFRVWPSTSALESAVSIARWRNLGLACIPNVLMLGAAIALVRYTRRSRLLAERQMNFVANVSHELRTPLTVIRGAGHNLLRGIVREQRQIDQYLRLIIQHADQLNGMIEQVLELADARKKAVTNEGHQPVDIAEELDAAIASTLSDTRAAGCEIQATILRNLPKVDGDATALRRVFQNLLTNAAKYGAVAGWIGVETAFHHVGAQTWVEVQVMDRGPGIPEQELAGIFEPFFRGAAAQNRQVRGTGLGLSLVHEIVQAHGGTAAVRSQPWKGTVFTIRLPAAGLTKTRKLNLPKAKQQTARLS